MYSRSGRNVNKNRARYRVLQLTLGDPLFCYHCYHRLLPLLIFSINQKKKTEKICTREVTNISALLLLCEYGPAWLIWILRNRFQLADLVAELSGKLLQQISSRISRHIAYNSLLLPASYVLRTRRKVKSSFFCLMLLIFFGASSSLSSVIFSWQTCELVMTHV